MGEYVFYADESRHAGINYLDPHQPYHLAAGFLIAASKAEDARDVARRLEGPHVGVKASGKLKCHRGRNQIVELFRSIGAVGAVPFFVIMDRRFSLVGKIVEMFVDPEHHSASAWLPRSEVKRRNALTETLVDELDEDLLAQIAEAYKAASELGFRAVPEALIADRSTQSDCAARCLLPELAVGSSLPAPMEDEPVFGGAFARDRTIARILLAPWADLILGIGKMCERRATCASRSWSRCCVPKPHPSWRVPSRMWSGCSRRCATTTYPSTLQERVVSTCTAWCCPIAA